MFRINCDSIKSCCNLLSKSVTIESFRNKQQKKTFAEQMARLSILLVLMCAVTVTPTLHKLKALKEKLLFGGGGGGGCNTCGMLHMGNGGGYGGGGGGYGGGGGGGGGFGFGYGGGGGFAGGGGGGSHYVGNKVNTQMYDYGGNKGHGQMYDYGGNKGHGGQDNPTIVIVKEVPNTPSYGGNHGGDYGGHTSYGGNKGGYMTGGNTGFRPTGGDSAGFHGRPGGYGGSNAGSYASSSSSSFSSAGSGGYNQGGQPNSGSGVCHTCGGSDGQHMPSGGFVAHGTYASSQSSSSASAGAWSK